MKINVKPPGWKSFSMIIILTSEKCAQALFLLGIVPSLPNKLIYCVHETLHSKIERVTL